MKKATSLLRKADLGVRSSAKRSWRQVMTNRKLRLVLLGVVAVITIVVVVNFFRLQRKNHLLKTNPRAVQQDEEKKYVSQLRRLTYPPEKEAPTIAIITDADKARQQNSGFYKQAKNGDVVVKYKSIAYILDAKNDKLVNIAPVYDEQ